MNQALLGAVPSNLLKSLTDAVSAHKTLALTGLPDGEAAFIASKLAVDTGMRVMVVSANDIKAIHLAEDGQQLLDNNTACLTGGELDLTRGASSHESAWNRLETLSRIVSGEVRLLSTSMDALVQKMGSSDLFRSATIRLQSGDRIDPNTLLSRLIRMGYERMDMVEGKGQCSLRGAILDVYPPSLSNALRIEFFDDEVDSIRTFDCISQRSLSRIDEAVLTPATEILLAPDCAKAAADRMRSALRSANNSAPDATPLLFEDLPPIPEDDEALSDYFDANIAPKATKKATSATREAELEHRISALMRDAEAVEQGLPFRRIRTWLTVLTDDTQTLLDWYRPQVIFLCQPDRLRERAKDRLAGFSEELTNAMDRGEAVSEQQSLLMDWDTLSPILANYSLVTVTDMLQGLGGVHPEVVLNLHSNALTGYNSQIKALATDLCTWRKNNYAIALLSGGVARGKRLQQSLQELEVPSFFDETSFRLTPGAVTILPITLSHGFVWPDASLVVVSDSDIYGSGYRKSKSRRNSGEKISAFTDLKKGDYVVHEDHGVGIYQGTTQLTSQGAVRDYLLIQYAGNDKLYIPIEQLARVQRYIGNPSQPPKLNRIGGTEWNRQKSKVKDGLRKLAFDLVELYARRQQTTGHAFSPDTPWQREFEDQFPFELTPDQAQSVQEITADMESDRTMDRLLCGDVGYGKTEVSLRAAFKAVMDSKQVAILAPTTILAQQHYNTVIKRFAGFPVRVEVLSRFKTTKEIKQILGDVALGKVDILVGTHRLLGKDVHFKDLGLLIVDEEQRFGVGHKEIIKNMKKQVDVLTLSATPIPRTLHMSMVGIRDMSVLETPPEARLPVQTHVVEYSDSLIRDAILRELSRGGQVYFLYNRVRSIERFYQRLRALVPEARIGVAHGQMKEHGLEDVMMDFYAGSYDVLLCTTIIESGLDVPTANTLIVFDAERFGLSQLYQLRGRVGRSDRQAYAYFTVRQDKLLSETAQQRLNAIREFTEFGSGFRIAMRDLEIRGAGNILGPEQHGHLSTVGYELYCKLIEETLHEVQGVSVDTDLETRVDLHVDAFLPADYIKDEHQRMEMYKRIAALSSDADREDIIDELVDRFGDTPAVVDSLLNVAQMRYLCNHIGVMQVSNRQGTLVMRIDDRYVKEPLLLFNAMKETDTRLALSSVGPSAILFSANQKEDALLLKEGLKMMRRLVDRFDQLMAEKKGADSAKEA